MKIECPFCTFKKYVNKEAPNRTHEIRRLADLLRYHLRHECPIHFLGYVEDYL